MAQIKLLGKTSIQGKTIFATDQAPTYTITRSASSVDEGSSITFTLSTTNVANGTVLPYTISGISANDVTSGTLTGSFTVSNNLATATITMSADQLTEGAETATLTLNNAAASNFVVVNDTSVWTPNLISGLQLWLDASDTSTLYDATAGGSLVTTDGSAVARWNDKSGNNRHATQATSNARPLLKTGANGINSKTVLSFDGSNDFLTSSVTGFKNLSAASIIGVVSTAIAAQADTQTMVLFGFGNISNAGSGFPTNRGLGISSVTGVLNGEKITFLGEKDASSNNGRLGSTTYSRAANTAQSLQLELGSTGTQLYANNSSVNLNLANQISTSTNMAPNQLGFTLDDNLLLCAGRANGTVFTSGVNQKMAEFLVFDRKLTSGERSTLWSYLQTKWNIA
jgi:hypothetical protein